MSHYNLSRARAEHINIGFISTFAIRGGGTG